SLLKRLVGDRPVAISSMRVKVLTPVSPPLLTKERSVEIHRQQMREDIMSDQNKALAARIPLEAFNQGKLEVIDEVIAGDSVDHGQLPPGMAPGKGGRKLVVKAARSAVRELKSACGLQVAAGARLAGGDS